MRILLIGKNGQLGWELRQRLERTHDVIAVGREDINFRDAHHLHDTLRRLPELSLIVNTAAYTDVDRAEREPLTTELINVEAPAILAAEADRRGIPMIHFSTDYVFNGKKWTTPYTETDRPNPLNVYGWSKLAGEQRVRDLCEKHLIFRVSSLYGTRRRNFLTTMLKFLNAGKPPRVVDDQIVSPNWYPMIAEAVEQVVTQILGIDCFDTHDSRHRHQHPTEAGHCNDAAALNRVKAQPWGIYHLTGTGSTSWYEFARLIFEKYSELWSKPLIVPEAVSSEEFGAEAKRPPCSILNPNKFTQIFHYALPDWKTQFLYCVNLIQHEFKSK